MSAAARRAVALACLAGLAGMAFVTPVYGPARFWANYVVWFLFLLSAALGALFVTVIEHLVGARWSVPIRRAPERLATLLVPLAPVALLALCALPVLYPWARPDAPHSALTVAKSAWLNVPFFSGRLILCLAFWLAALKFFVGGSLAQDRSRDPAVTVRLRKAAPAFMILFGCSVTVVAFDWLSSLDPDWYSDIIGVYLFAGVFLAGLAGTTLVLARMVEGGRLPGVTADHLYNLGAFLFAFTVFWSYIAFAQYLLMWYGNLPDEVTWYRVRTAGGWQVATLLLAVVHFAIPFLALVPRDAKRRLPRLKAVACLILAGHVLDLHWLIFPSLGFAPLPSWPELCFGLFFIGAALLFLARALTWGGEMPVGDPHLQEGLAFRL